MLTRGVQLCGIGDVFIFRVTTPSNIIVLPGLAVWVSWRTGLWIYGSIDLTTKQFISEGKERKMIPNDSVVLNDSTWSRVIPAEMSVHACTDISAGMTLDQVESFRTTESFGIIFLSFPSEINCFVVRSIEP